MYLLYCLALLVFLYAAPGLALAPRLATTPPGVAAVPAVSAFVLYCTATLLSAVGLLTPDSVRVVCLGMAITAVLRVARVRATVRRWSRADVALLTIAVALLVPALVRMGTDSFSYHDEIYSWNLWGVQILLGHPLERGYTACPYPQLFSKVIALSYALLGDRELQLPVKAALTVFPLGMLLSIAYAAPRRDFGTVAVYAIVVPLVLYAARTAAIFGDALADPVMAACLVTSVALFLRAREDGCAGTLWLAALTGVAAGLTKQPALWWSTVVFPLLVFREGLQRTLPRQAAMAAGLSTGVSLAWMRGAGRGFLANAGVVQRSLDDAGSSEAEEVGPKRPDLRPHPAIEEFLLKIRSE